jgi:hypothetical protein
LKDAEIKAANGRYAALNLPAKTAELTIESADPATKKNILKYNGGVSLKSALILDNIDLTPVNAAQANGADVETAADVAVGGYALTLKDTDTLTGSGASVIRNISGTKAGKLILKTDGTSEASPYTVRASQVTGLTDLEVSGDTVAGKQYAALIVDGKNSITTTTII